MAKIKMNLEALKESSNSLAMHLSEVEELNARYESIISQIDTLWEGEACRKFVSSMNSYITKTKEVIEVISAYKSYVDEAIKQTESTDSSSSQLIETAF